MVFSCSNSLPLVVLGRKVTHGKRAAGQFARGSRSLVKGTSG